MHLRILPLEVANTARIDVNAVAFLAAIANQLHQLALPAAIVEEDS
jgi:hypothetical protein